MRLYETKVIWSHGSRFVVRRVETIVRAEGRLEYTYHYGRNGWRGECWVKGQVVDRVPGYALHGPNGEFARLEYRQLRKWIAFFALQALRNGV